MRRPSPTSTARAFDEITLNGRSLDPAAVYADSRISLDDLQADNTLVVTADCPYSNTGEGLHRFVDPADDRVYLYSQFEVPDARRVFTTFEQPDLKSVFTFNVTAPSHWKVVSNSPTPEPTDLGDGRAVWNFGVTERMSTYITAVVAGEYHEVLDTYEGKFGTIPLGHYCRQSLVEHMDTEVLVELTKQSFEFFEEKFDFPYPFHKYDQLYVPEYNMGAMENAGCVTLRDEYLPRSRQPRSFFEFRASVITHEMAHMWFGDLVTMTLVGRPVAQRVLRRVGLLLVRGRGHRVHRRLDRLRQRPQADRLPRRPAALDAPDRRRQRRPARGRGQLRHDHLRQGRLGAQAARRVGRHGRLRRGHPRLLQAARLRQHRVLRPAGRPGEVLGSRAGELGHGVAADGRRQHADARLRARRRRQLRLVLDRPDRAPGLADAASPPPRHRPLRRRRVRHADSPRLPRGRRGGRFHRRRRARRHHPARTPAAQRRGPRLRQDPPRRALARHGDRRAVQGRELAWPAPSSGAPPGT